ncbi:hypothetical protein XENORESO_006452 [Xenotaenia resolanae]|uniref:Uncharacterized protein n=1 Tax=Xenotaenia resolanae TaxID=208358 RepID=A0ABV0WSH9_9TELE
MAPTFTVKAETVLGQKPLTSWIKLLKTDKIPSSSPNKTIILSALIVAKFVHAAPNSTNILIDLSNPDVPKVAGLLSSQEVIDLSKKDTFKFEGRMERGYYYKSAYDALTFAPTALPRLMAFFSLCCPPEDGESMKVEPELELAEAEERLVEC